MATLQLLVLKHGRERRLAANPLMAHQRVEHSSLLFLWCFFNFFIPGTHLKSSSLKARTVSGQICLFDRAPTLPSVRTTSKKTDFAQIKESLRENSKSARTSTISSWFLFQREAEVSEKRKIKLAEML